MSDQVQGGSDSVSSKFVLWKIEFRYPFQYTRTHVCFFAAVSRYLYLHRRSSGIDLNAFEALDYIVQLDLKNTSCAPP